MHPLDGKRIALTGAAGGIGSLVAARLRGLGAQVLGIDRAESVACAEAWTADLSMREGVARIARDLSAREVDILINAAGLQYFGPIEDQAAEGLWNGYAVNLIAPAQLTAAVVPGMRARGDGQIVNIGSVMGAINYPYFATYSSSKAGLRGLSEALRRELSPQGIAVTHIAPRAVDTAFNGQAVNRFLAAVKMTADAPEQVADRIVAAIADRRALVSIGARERLFAGINAILPRVIDGGLASQARAARALFNASN
jgi:short-subunit dehydrogenase